MAVSVFELPTHMFTIDMVMPFHLVVDWPPNRPEFDYFINIVHTIVEPEFEIKISARGTMFKVTVPSIPLELYEFLNNALKEEEVDWVIIWDIIAWTKK